MDPLDKKLKFDTTSEDKASNSTSLLCYLGIVTLLISGCAGAALNRDYGEYSKAYSLSTNQQLLRNLARLRNDDPPYFLQLGQISSQSSFQGSLGFSPGNTTTTHPSGVAGPWNSSQWALGGMIGANASQTPTFQFLPLSGDSLTQAISIPITENIFYSFIKQGWPVDIVARTIVDYIDVRDTSKVTDKQVATLQNLKGDELIKAENEVLSKLPIRRLFNDPENSDYTNYHDFLVWCYNYRVLQDHHLLTIDSAPQGDDGSSDSNNQSSPLTLKDVKLGDVVTAKQAGYTVKNGPLGYSISSTQVHPAFGPVPLDHRFLYSWEIEPHSSKSLAGKVPEVPVVSNQKLALMSLILKTPVSVDTENQPQVQVDEGSVKPSNAHHGSIGLRTFIEVMTDASKEELAFNRFTNDQRYLDLIDNNGNQTLQLINPILSLTHPTITGNESYDELVEDEYRGSTYYIGDIRTDEFDGGEEPRSFQVCNKKVFMLLTYLFSDVSIDPKKLPVQQVLSPAP